MTDKYQAIRDALAAGPTPGPWHVSKHNDARAALVYDADGFEVARVCYPNRDASARLIAACDPETIAELLAEFDKLADTQRAIIEAAEKRGYERAIAEMEQKP